MAASFLFWPAGPAARPAGGDLAERAVAPGLLVFGRRAAPGAPHHPRGVVPAGPFACGGLDPGGRFPRPQVAAVRHPAISRENASITSAVYAVPAQVGTKVKSTTHSRSGASGAKSLFTRSSGRPCDGSGRVVRTL